MSSFRQTLVSLLGAWPQRVSLDAIVHERSALPDGVVRETVSYAVEPGERVPAYLFRPPSATTAQPQPAVFVHHQHAGQFDLGKSEPAGLAGNPDQACALELAQRGYVVLAPDALCFEERGDPDGRLTGRSYERFAYTTRVLQGSSLQTKYVWDQSRGVDYLQSRSEVDGGRIGAIGHSLGGQQTLFLAALDERIGAAVASCGFASYASILREGINHNFAAYVTDVLRHGDLGDVFACVAPRPFLILNGKEDRSFPVDGIEATHRQAREAYEQVGAADALELGLFDGGHAFPSDRRERAYAWLDRWLDRTGNAGI